MKIECHESDIQLAFLGLNSPYVVRDEFQHMLGRFNTEFASLNPVRKQRLKDEFHNVIVNENSYKNITGFKAGKLGIANAKQNAKWLLLSTAAGEKSVVSTDSASFWQQLPYTEHIQISGVDSDNIQFPNPDSLVFL